MIGSILPFKVENGAGNQIKRRFKSLLSFDEVRVMQLFENIQYGVIYFILGFVAGAGLDSLFPKFDEHQAIQDVIIETLGQAIIIIIAIFYIKKIAKIVPFMFVLNWDLNGNGKVSHYRPYESYEYGGNVMIGLVMLGSQFNFLKKIDLISRVIYSKFLGLDSRVTSAM